MIKQNIPMKHTSLVIYKLYIDSFHFINTQTPIHLHSWITFLSILIHTFNTDKFLWKHNIQMAITPYQCKICVLMIFCSFFCRCCCMKKENETFFKNLIIITLSVILFLIIVTMTFIITKLIHHHVLLSLSHTHKHT